MSGTNFRSGVSARKQYSGTNVNGDRSAHSASTKLIRKTAVIRCDALTALTQSAFTLPAGAIVYDVMLHVDALEAGVTVSVGTLGGAISDYLLGASIANVGLVQGDLADGAITLGSLLYEETGTGADVAYARRPDIASSGEVITYQATGGTQIGEFDIIVEYADVVHEAQ